MRNLFKNIKSGFRLAAFRPVSLWDFCFGKWQATWLFLCLVVLSAGVEYCFAGLGATVNNNAVSGFLLTLVISLAGFFLIAQFLGYKYNGRYIVVALAAVIPVTLISALVEGAVQSALFVDFVDTDSTLSEWIYFLFFVLLLVWLVAVIMSTIRVAFLTGKRKSLFFSIAFVLFVSVGTMLLTQQQRMFLAVPDAGAQSFYLLDDMEPRLTASAQTDPIIDADENTFC